MDDMGKALVIVLAIDVMLFLLQFSVLSINPEGPHFFNYNGSSIQSFDAGNYTLDTSSTGDRLPEAAGVTETDSNWFTDTWNTIKNWLLNTTGLKYLLQILSGPGTVLTMLNVPLAFAYAIGAMWYGLTLFLLISWGLGRNQ